MKPTPQAPQFDSGSGMVMLHRPEGSPIDVHTVPLVGPMEALPNGDDVHVALVRDLEGQLGRWGARIDDLVVRAADPGPDTEREARYRAELGEIKARYAWARQKLDELRDAQVDDRGLLSGGVERAWTDLEIAFDNLTG